MILDPDLDHGLRESSSWGFVDLRTVLTTEQPPSTMLPRSDGKCLLYSGRVHGLHAEPEALKTWLALYACGVELRNCYSDSDRVLYLDFEDTAASILGRLAALGLSHQEIIDGGFGYRHPDEPIIEGSRAKLDLEDLCWAEPELVVIDGLTEAFLCQGLSPFDNSEVAAWFKLIVQPLKRAGVGTVINGGMEDEYVRQDGPAIVLLDHVVKDKDSRGRYAIGAQHKLAGVDVAYSLRVIEPFARGHDGLISVKVEKYRPGRVREFADSSGCVALLRARSLPDGKVQITLDPPDGTDAAPSFRPTGQMERISRLVETTPGLSKRSIREAVTGKNSIKDLAIELLNAEGYVEVRVEGQASHHYSLKPFREEEGRNKYDLLRDPPEGSENGNRAPVPQPCPDRAPGTVSNRAPVPLPLEGHGHGHNGTGSEGSTVPRAPAAPTPDLDAVADRIRQAARTAQCCCVGGADELAEDGRCSRCGGWPES